MANLRLTDINQATAVTSDSLIHIVNTGDTTQFSGGSSYKASLSQVFDSLSGYCIPHLYVTNLHGCSPITIQDSVNSNGSTSSGVLSFAFGNNNNATGNYSHAQGTSTSATTTGAHSEGNSTIASGFYSHSEGRDTIAYGQSSHVEGLGTISNGNYQHISGQYNLTANTQSAFIIGNGTNSINRKNLFVASGTNVEIPSGNTFQYSNSPSNGYVLTSDSVGVASWQQPTDLYITGMTFNNGNFNLTISRNDGTDFTQSLYILSTDMTVTGGTYNPSTGVASFTTNSGNTFEISGFTTGYTDTNIYNGNGTLTGNRTVSLGGYSLDFDRDININNISFGAGANPPVTNDNIAIGNGSLISNTSGEKNISIGEQSLNSNTIGARNVSIGTYSLLNSDGDGNVSIGYQSLYENTTGNENISLGTNSLYSNDSGFRNVSIGYNTMYNSESGYDNISLGTSSLYNNTSGIENISIGFQSMYSLDGGSENISLGSESMYSNVTGNDNISIGTNSLYSLTGNNYNISLGNSSLENLTDGYSNVSIGFSSLQQLNLGGQNTSIGHNSLSSLLYGSNNISIGDNSGFDLTSGSTNIIIGKLQGSSLINGNSNVIIGQNISGLNPTISNNIIIADGGGNRRINVDSSGNVGLGTNSPTQRLSVDGNLNFTNTSFGGLRLNNLTTAQRNALTPSVGTVVYDTDLGVTCTYKGAFWDYTMIKTPSGTGTTTTSTGAANISGLTFSVESGSTYIIEGWISIYCLSTGGVKFGHTFPSGAYATLWLDGINNNALSSIKTGTVGSLLPGTSTGFNSSPATTQFSSVIVKGLITTTNSGTFQLQFARGTGSVANVSITSNTFIKLTKIS